MSKFTTDEKLAIKMLARYKEIRRNSTKPFADIDLMLELLNVVRQFEAPTPLDQSKINRLEIIGEKGREFVNYSVVIELSLQDNGKTLKIFKKSKKEEIKNQVETFIDNKKL